VQNLCVHDFAIEEYLLFLHRIVVKNSTLFVVQEIAQGRCELKRERSHEQF
jgi:hypothetical protein